MFPIFGTVWQQKYDIFISLWSTETLLLNVLILPSWKKFKCLTFARIVSVRETFFSAWLSCKPKSLGPRTAGAKNRRNRKALTAVYFASYKKRMLYLKKWTGFILDVKDTYLPFTSDPGFSRKWSETLWAMFLNAARMEAGHELTELKMDVMMASR